MEIIIRCAKLEDASAITRIIRDIGWFDYLESESPKITEERVKRHLTLCLADQSHSTFVAESADGKVVGYVSVHYLPYFFLTGLEGYISELFIDKETRGTGVGTALLDEVITEAKKHGCSRLTLINSRTRESYKRKFYEQRGWKERTEIAAFVLPLIEN